MVILNESSKNPVKFIKSSPPVLAESRGCEDFAIVRCTINRERERITNRQLQLLSAADLFSTRQHGLSEILVATNIYPMIFDII